MTSPASARFIVCPLPLAPDIQVSCNLESILRQQSQAVTVTWGSLVTETKHELNI